MYMTKLYMFQWHPSTILGGSQDSIFFVISEMCRPGDVTFLAGRKKCISVTMWLCMYSYECRSTIVMPSHVLPLPRSEAQKERA